MPIIKSAKKRVKTAQKAAVRNSKTKRTFRAAIKDFDKSLTGDKKKASATYAKAQSAIDKAGKKHVIHKNKVARKQRQLAAAAKAAGVKVTPGAKKPVRQAQDKPAAKPAPAKKPDAKKAPAKKS